MTGLLADYLPLIIFLGVSLFIAVALLIAPFVVAYSSPDPEKLSAYECGFNAFDDARMKFDVRFYLVAILFIIDQKPNQPSSPKVIAQGNKKATSRSKMMNRIATR